MAIRIFFDVLSSPTEAFASVRGKLLVQKPMGLGDEVPLLDCGERDWFSGSLLVQAIAGVNIDGDVMIALENLLAPSREDAARVVARLEKDADLRCEACK
jgi:hypothetical protein